MNDTDKEIYNLKFKIDNIERNIKEQQEELDELKKEVTKMFDEKEKDIEELKRDQTYAKGFIKAVLLFAGVAAFVVEIVNNFIHK